MSLIPYVDLNTIQTYNSGDILTAAALQQIRSNGEFFVDPPACSVYHAGTADSVLNTTAKVLSGDSELFDNDSMHSTSTNNSRITVQTAGRYLLTARATFSPNATGIRILTLLVNGTTSYDLLRINATSSGSTRFSGTQMLTLSAADYVEVQVQQDSGSTLTATLVEFSAAFLTR